MSNFSIRYRPEVHDDLDEIPSNVQKRIKRAIERRLEPDPDKYGERLTRSLLGLWRVRSGDYRIVFEIDDKSNVVTIWAIRHRKNIYPTAEQRWRRGP